MSDLFQFINSKSTSFIEIGVVDSFIGKQKYNITTGGISVVAKSAISQILEPGVQVIINKVESGRYIVGVLNQLKSQSAKEIIING